MENKTKGFVLYEDYREYFAYLSKEEKADLIDAIFAFGFDGEEPEGLSNITALAFAVIRNQLERDRIKYDKKCETNRKNGALGGRPKRAEESVNKRSDENESGAAEQSEGENSGDSGEDRVMRERFDTFWGEYPKKTGQQKAYEIFRRIAPDEDLLSKMLSTLSWQKRSSEWLREGGRYVPYGANWLSDKRWKDEPPPPVASPSSSAFGERGYGSFSTEDFFASSLKRGLESFWEKKTDE